MNSRMKSFFLCAAELRLFGLATLLIPPFSARAEVQLPSIIGDHMVLQQQEPGGGVWIWGRAERDEKVEVRLGSAVATAVGDDLGTWACQLAGLPSAGGPYEMTVTGRNTLTVHDVLVGEVWLCSGQSNMGFTVNETKDHAAEIAAADHPTIRLFSVNHQVSVMPSEDARGEWRVCSPKTVGGFSAVGYFFGRDVQESLRVPVGLIDSSWGGTPAEAWTPLAAMAAVPELREIVEKYQVLLARMGRLPLDIAKYDAKLQAWSEEKAQGKAGDKEKPRDPRPGRRFDQNSPTALYNGMILPLVPYGMRGAVWYQGESNASRAGKYVPLLSAMIDSWRQVFPGGSYPFYIVQLANFMDRKPVPADSDWAALREAQSKVAQTVPHSGLAVCIDLGEAKNIHPTDKQDVGHRLALLAEARTYGQNVVDQGPVYQGTKVEGDKIRVSFQPSTSALVSHTGAKLAGFAVAGEDRRFAWADATIDGGEVVVHCDRIAAPVAVRYAWADNPEVSLYNEAGLPAAPFRSDDWTRSEALPETPSQH